MDLDLSKIECMYSAKMRFVSFRKNQEEQFVNDCVFIFSAENIDAAYEQAIMIGKRAQNLTGFINIGGVHVVQRLINVMTLSKIKECAGIYDVHSDATIEVSVVLGERAIRRGGVRFGVSHCRCRSGRGVSTGVGVMLARFCPMLL